MCVYIYVYIYMHLHTLSLSLPRALSLSLPHARAHTRTHTHTQTLLRGFIYTCIYAYVMGIRATHSCLSRTHTNAHTHLSPPFPHMWVSPPIHWVGDIRTTRMSSWCWFLDMKITQVSSWYIDHADHSYVHYLNEFVTLGWVGDVDFLIWRSLKWVRDV